MSENRGAIGLIDSGVGGLTVLKEFITTMPREQIVYFGDTLHLPYGPRRLTQVREFVHRIVSYLIAEKGIKIIVLACNTATSAALEAVKKEYSLPAYGTIEGATRRAVKLTEKGKIGIIGTEGTIDSRAYQQAILNYNGRLKVYSAACPEFVDLVEEGKFRGPEVDRIIRQNLTGLKKRGIDVLILGCTHFPYLIEPLKKFLGPGVTLVSSAVEMAREVKRDLQTGNLNRTEGERKGFGQREFIVSDRSRISRLFLLKGRKFLGLPSLNFKEENIFTESRK